MTPPRAGTFMYHTHAHEVAQMGGGLYAPLLAVMRPARLIMGTGETWDVELTPTEARELTLEIVTAGRAGLAPVRSVIPVSVRD